MQRGARPPPALITCRWAAPRGGCWAARAAAPAAAAARRRPALHAAARWRLLASESSRPEDGLQRTVTARSPSTAAAAAGNVLAAAGEGEEEKQQAQEQPGTNPWASLDPSTRKQIAVMLGAQFMLSCGYGCIAFCCTALSLQQGFQ